MKTWLTRAAKKIRHFRHREYCGYLTIAEITRLHDENLITTLDGLEDENLRYIRERKEKGQSGSRWHYFHLLPGTELTTILDRNPQ
jgi:hypothetical protein